MKLALAASSFGVPVVRVGNRWRRICRFPAESQDSYLRASSEQEIIS